MLHASSLMSHLGLMVVAAGRSCISCRILVVVYSTSSCRLLVAPVMVIVGPPHATASERRESGRDRADRARYCTDSRDETIINSNKPATGRSQVYSMLHLEFKTKHGSSFHPSLCLLWPQRHPKQPRSLILFRKT